LSALAATAAAAAAAVAAATATAASEDEETRKVAGDGEENSAPSDTISLHPSLSVSREIRLQPRVSFHSGTRVNWKIDGEVIVAIA